MKDDGTSARFPIFVIDRHGRLARIGAPGGLAFFEPSEIVGEDAYAAFDADARRIQFDIVPEGPRERVVVGAIGEVDEAAFRREVARAVNVQPLADGLDLQVSPISELSSAIRELDAANEIKEPSDGADDDAGMPVAIRIAFGLVVGVIAYFIAGIWAGTLIAVGIGAAVGFVAMFPRRLFDVLDGILGNA